MTEADSYVLRRRPLIGLRNYGTFRFGVGLSDWPPKRWRVSVGRERSLDSRGVVLGMFKRTDVY